MKRAGHRCIDVKQAAQPTSKKKDTRRCDQCVESDASGSYVRRCMGHLGSPTPPYYVPWTSYGGLQGFSALSCVLWVQDRGSEHSSTIDSVQRNLPDLLCGPFDAMQPPMLSTLT